MEKQKKFVARKKLLNALETKSQLSQRLFMASLAITSIFLGFYSNKKLGTTSIDYPSFKDESLLSINCVYILSGIILLLTASKKRCFLNLKNWGYYITAVNVFILLFIIIEQLGYLLDHINANGILHGGFNSSY